jgi:hypothetical protein
MDGLCNFLVEKYIECKTNKNIDECRDYFNFVKRCIYVNNKFN